MLLIAIMMPALANKKTEMQWKYHPKELIYCNLLSDRILYTTYTARKYEALSVKKDLDNKDA